MVHVLTYLRKRGVLEDKNSQILVPQWLCLSFLQLVRKYSSPTLDPRHPVKVAIAYHQYGFPQNMDEVLDFADRKRVLLIEDCANLFEGYYRGKRLGTFGLASIFSLSKVFPSLWGGGLATLDEELYQHALVSQPQMHRSWVSALLHGTRYLTDRNREDHSPVLDTLTLMAYARAEDAQYMSGLSKRAILKEVREKSLTRRAENYRYLLERFANRSYFDDLEREGVFPYVAPLFAPAERLEKISEALRNNGITSGVYNFDINRNVFNPRFVKCAWVPVHQGLSTSQMNRIAEIIEQADG